jgi:hypothetical protein
MSCRLKYVNNWRPPAAPLSQNFENIYYSFRPNALAPIRALLPSLFFRAGKLSCSRKVSLMYQLTLQQFQVIDALSNGATFTDAAAQAGADRNTLADWRACDDFREALADAYYDRAALYRDRAIALADLAFEAIRKVLTDPKSSPSVLLRAATLIIDKITTPPQYREQKPADLPDMLAAMDAADRMHFAQQHQADAQECTTAPNAFQMHNDAQPEQPYRRPEPKIGRNELCPCGSGRKYKQCCLNKPLAASA